MAEISEYADKFWLRTDRGYVEEYMHGEYDPPVSDNHFFDDLTYVDNDGKNRKYPKLGEGPASLASESDLARDELGFTNKNLHRRVDPKEPKTVDKYNQELAPREYTLSIHDVYSYRTTNVIVHDEEQTDIEIP